MVLRAKDTDCTLARWQWVHCGWRLVPVAGTSPMATQQLALQLALIGTRADAYKAIGSINEGTVYSISHAKVHLNIPIPDHDNDVFHSLYSSKFIRGSERRKREKHFQNAATCI